MKMKYTVMGQILSILLEHLKAAFIFFFAWGMAVMLVSSGIGGIIYSAFTTLFYFMMMYASGYTAAKNDKKSYSPLTPIQYKGALLSVGVILVNIIVVIIYILVWKLESNGESLLSWRAVALNALHIFWFSPFINFLGEQKGALTPIGYVLIFLTPILSCFLGYFAAYHNFDISEKLKFLVYENKNKS